MRLTVYNQIEIRKRWVVVYAFLALTLAQVFVISMFSSQPALASTRVSDKIVNNLTFVPESIPRHSEEKGVITLTYIVRKMAHFYNFAFLGALFGTNKNLLKNNLCQSLIWALLGGLVAVADEAHQYFVPGRCMKLEDILIDFSGILFGICVIELIFGFVFYRRNNGRGKKDS